MAQTIIHGIHAAVQHNIEIEQCNSHFDNWNLRVQGQQSGGGNDCFNGTRLWDKTLTLF